MKIEDFKFIVRINKPNSEEHHMFLTVEKARIFILKSIKFEMKTKKISDMYSLTSLLDESLTTVTIVRGFSKKKHAKAFLKRGVKIKQECFPEEVKSKHFLIKQENYTIAFNCTYVEEII